MEWMVSEDKLDREQREFLDNFFRTKNNYWIKGLPGTGKSVLLLYILRNILQRERNSSICVVVFTHSLKQLFMVGIKELNIQSRIKLITFYEFLEKDFSTYDYVLCDEVQDLTGKALSAMQRRGRRVLVAGDENQSIYDCDPRYREKTVSPDEIQSLINAADYQLRNLHRLPKSIVNAIKKIDSNLNVLSSRINLSKRDYQIKLCKGKSKEEEVKYIYQEALEAVNAGESSVILLPSNSKIIEFAIILLSALNKKEWNYKANMFDKPDYSDLNWHLKTQGIKMQYIGSGYGNLIEAAEIGNIVLMTYFSAKGLDFDNSFLPFFDNTFYLQPDKLKPILIVAMTRCKKQLSISYTGFPHPILSKFSDDCVKIDISQSKQNNTTQFDLTDDYIF